MFNFFNKKLSEFSISSLIAMGRYEEALNLINQLIETDKKNTELYIQKGKCLQSLKDYEEAIESYKKALELKTDSRQPYIGIAECEASLGDYQKSADYYIEAEKIRGLNRNQMLKYVKILEKLGEYNKALEYIKEFPTIPPFDMMDLELQKIKVKLLLKSDKPKEAMDLLERLDPLLMQKDYTIDIYRADALLSMKKTDEATYIIERLMKQIPNSTYVKSLYSRLLIEKGQYKSALDMVNEGLKNNPYDAKLHYLMLDLLIKEAEYKKAMITLEGSSNHISKQAYINYKSKIYLKMGNEEKAINYSDKSIEEYPEDAYIRISRAELMYELYNNYKDKDYNKAHKFQEKAIENLNLAKEYTNNIDYIKKINELKEKLE